MRNFTLCVAATLLSVSAAAAPLKQANNHSFRQLTSEKPALSLEQLSRFGERKAAPASLHEMRSGKKMVKASATRGDEGTLSTDIITEQPAGKLTNWAKDCVGYMVFWGMILGDQVQGSVQQMVEGDDGNIYLNIVFSQYPLPETWIKAEKNADGGLTIPAGQCVAKEFYGEDEYYYYIYPFSTEYDADLDDYVYAYGDAIVLDYVDGKYVSADPEVFVGLCENDESTGGDIEFVGYADQDMTIYPMNDVAIEMPAGNVEKWAAINGEEGFFVDVLIDGDKMYIEGLDYAVEKGVIVGDIKGDEVVFKAGQFIGKDLYYWTWTYVYGGEVEMIWDEEYEMEFPEATATGDLVFSYDADEKKLVSKSAVIIANYPDPDIEKVVPSGYIEEVTIELQHRNPDAAPMDPQNVAFEDLYEDFGYNSIDFVLPEMDVDGNLLDADNLYYRLYVDGEPFIFYDDEYPDVDEDGQELIQAGFSNWDNIWTSGTWKTVYFLSNGMDEIGVQAVYMQPVEGGEPKEVASKIVTVETSSVKELTSAPTANSRYFDLQGREVKNPSAGIYLRVDTKTDGSRKAVKVVK